MVVSSHVFWSLSQAQSMSSTKVAVEHTFHHVMLPDQLNFWIAPDGKKSIFHLNPTEPATPTTFYLKKLSKLSTIHSPQNNLGASYRYLGWDFKRCYLVSFNFEWDFLWNMWFTCSKWGWKEYFTAWIHPKKFHTTIEHWQKWRKNFKMIHNENWTNFKFHCTILVWADHEISR